MSTFMEYKSVEQINNLDFHNYAVKFVAVLSAKWVLWNYS